MSSSSETGHARNVAHFESLVEHCASYGAAYAPSNPALALAALQAKLAEARTLLNDVRVAKTAYDNATNTREIAFAGLRPLATRAVTALKASGAATQTVDDARTRLNRLRGTRSTRPVPSLEQQPAEIPDTGPAGVLTPLENDVPLHRRVSSSHQSYDQLAETFASLVEVLAAEPLYQPAESGLSLADLQAFRANLIAATTGVLQQSVVYETAIIARNTALYRVDTGLLALAAGVKVYVKSLYGASSPQYRAVNGLSFRRVSAV